jgi:hypothetical protein
MEEGSMSISMKRVLATIAALALVLTAVGAGPAYAQKRAKPKRIQGKFISFDATANTIKVQERGKEVEYTVKPEGSILTRTSVKINGHGAKMADLRPDMRLFLYWIPDEKDPKKKFARTIDVPNVPEELQEEFDRQ